MQPTTLSRVVLPEPLGPSRPTTSPGKTDIETSTSASTRVMPSPKCFETACSSTSALGPVVSGMSLPHQRLGGVDLDGGPHAERRSHEADDEDDDEEHGDVSRLHLDAAREDALARPDRGDADGEA